MRTGQHHRYQIKETPQFALHKQAIEKDFIDAVMIGVRFALERKPERGQRTPGTEIWAWPTSAGTMYYKFDQTTVTLMAIFRANIL